MVIVMYIPLLNSLCKGLTTEVVYENTLFTAEDFFHMLKVSKIYFHLDACVSISILLDIMLFIISVEV